MPQILLELTSNIKLNKKKQLILEKLNDLVSSTCEININNCKSRIITHHEYSIGSSRRDHNFVHLRIELFSGKSKETTKTLGQSLLTFLSNSIDTSNQEIEPLNNCLYR